MKTTTYIFANGVTTKTISDQPELTPEQYRNACEVIKQAARNRLGSRVMRQVMHEEEQIALITGPAEGYRIVEEAV